MLPLLVYFLDCVLSHLVQLFLQWRLLLVRLGRLWLLIALCFVGIWGRFVDFVEVNLEGGWILIRIFPGLLVGTGLSRLLIQASLTLIMVDLLAGTLPGQVVVLLLRVPLQERGALQLVNFIQAILSFDSVHAVPKALGCLHQIAPALLMIVVVVARKRRLPLLILLHLLLFLAVLYLLLLGWTAAALRLPELVLYLSWPGRVLRLNCCREVIEWHYRRNVAHATLLDVRRTVRLTIYVQVAIRSLDAQIMMVLPIIGRQRISVHFVIGACSMLLFVVIHRQPLQIILAVLAEHAGVMSDATDLLSGFVALRLLHRHQTLLLVRRKTAMMLQHWLLRSRVIRHAGDLAQSALSFALRLRPRLLDIESYLLARRLHTDLRAPLPHLQRSTQLRPRLAALHPIDLNRCVKLLFLNTV